MRSALLFLAILLILSGNASAQPSEYIQIQDRDLWISGTNVAWVDFARDLGPGTVRFDEFERMFRELRANGGNAVRFWMHTTGGSTPAWNGHMVTGPGSGTLSNLKTLLDMAESHDVVVLLSLWSFDMLRISNGSTQTDRARAILTQPANRLSYIENALIPMVEHVKGHKGILAWEIFNEAEGMSDEFGWDFNRRVPMARIQEFVNLTAGAIKRTDPDAQVTTGTVNFTALSDIYSAINPLHFNYYRDDRLIQAGGDELGTLDFYTVHYYSYGDSPFQRHASYFQLGKPLAIGEFFLKGDTEGIPKESQFQKLFDNGYAGALTWQWVDWAQNREDNEATWPNTLLNTRHMYATHRDVTELVFSPKPGTFRIQVSDTVVEAGFTTRITWQSRDMASVRLNGVPVLVMGTSDPSPDVSTDYVFEFEDHDGVVVRDTVRIRVIPNDEVDRAAEKSVETDSGGLWAQVDFGRAYDIARIDYSIRNPDPAPQVSYFTSLDGNNWSHISGFESPVSARFLRIGSDTSFELGHLSAYGLLSGIQPPRLTIITPENGMTLENETRVVITAEAVRGTGTLSNFALRMNGQTIRTYRFPPYTYTWDISTPGEVDITFTATDSGFGAFSSRPVTVTVLPTVEKQRYEAESAVLGSGLTVVGNSAASGGQYVMMQSTGDLLFPAITAATTQTYVLRIGHNLPFGEKTQYLRVNGAIVDTVAFNPPLSIFKHHDVPITLNSGTNSIEIVNFWGWMWLDFVEVRGNGLLTSTVGFDTMPTQTRLDQNAPNPFNPTTVILYHLPVYGKAKLSVYDVLGREVAVLVDGQMSPGDHRATFDANGLASGIYLYRLQFGGQSLTRRMILVK